MLASVHCSAMVEWQEIRVRKNITEKAIPPSYLTFTPNSNAGRRYKPFKLRFSLKTVCAVSSGVGAGIDTRLRTGGLL